MFDIKLFRQITSPRKSHGGYMKNANRVENKNYAKSSINDYQVSIYLRKYMCMYIHKPSNKNQYTSSVIKVKENEFTQ